LNVVDSSAWLEYFAGGPGARHFSAAIEDTDRLIVPVIVLYEVFKRVLAQRGEDAALRAAAFMERGLVAEVNAALALAAARLSVEHRLPMADSLILATARATDATLWTLDADFEGLPSVRYFPR
jgi:predicted nucleic acid-binding protein